MRDFGPMPTFRGRAVEEQELDELTELLNSPARNPHTCVSKGQLMQVIRKLQAENYLLTKELEKRDERS